MQKSRARAIAIAQAKTDSKRQLFLVTLFATAALLAVPGLLLL
ncbi:hypothetical protein [Rhizobium sp. SSA_523]|nr:hypothetical protein [Rhizobium sp. SSA_523]WKC23945.1 hypothetical protein QTJ18_24775 [Rhizobium sp. SSA_523]